MKKIFLVVSLCIAMMSCEKESPYLIDKNKIGAVTGNTTMSQIESLFPNDSLVKTNLSNRFNTKKQDLEIYNKNRELIAVLEPRKNGDSTSTFKQARLMGAEFKTKKGLGPKATFKDIYENYTISSIQNAISNVIVSVDELGMYVSINKKHLPSEIRYDVDLTIEANQIPDDAPFQFFWLSFEEEAKENK